MSFNFFFFLYERRNPLYCCSNVWRWNLSLYFFFTRIFGFEERITQGWFISFGKRNRHYENINCRVVVIAGNGEFLRSRSVKPEESMTFLSFSFWKRKVLFLLDFFFFFSTSGLAFFCCCLLSQFRETNEADEDEAGQLLWSSLSSLRSRVMLYHIYKTLLEISNML